MSKKAAIAAITIGVLFNNYVYLHDIVMDKHEGLIHVGTTSAVGIAIALIVVAIGVRALAR